MEVALSVITKYLITIMCLIYGLSSVAVLSAKSNRWEKLLIRRQQFCMFAFHFASYLILFLQTNNIKIVGIYVVQVLFFKIAIWLYQYIYPNCSLALMNHMFFLLSVGFVMLSRLSFDKAVKQFIIVVLAFLISLVVPALMDFFTWIPKLGILYGLLGIVFLSLVFVIGSEKYGSVNWISIGGFALQPSEFVKILFVFFLSSMFAKAKSFGQIAVTTALAALHVLILVVEKDLGAALLYFVIYIVISYVATGRIIYFAGGLLSGGVAGVLAYILFAHVRNRVYAWQNPWQIIDGAGYQITQSLFAIGTGGWIGSGLTQGRPLDIPVVESDFIFSAISEELGLVFAILLIIICLLVFTLYMNIAMAANDPFYKLAGIGMGTCFIFQIFLNVGGVTKFIPSTGVTLPFVSYGGSSIVSSLLIMGIMQGLFMMGNREEEEVQNGQTE